jgi:hypothetical protein
MVQPKFEPRIRSGTLRREREWWHGYEYFLIGDQIVVVNPLFP